MSSASSTERGADRVNSGFQPWHFYLLVSLAGATWAVIVSRDTQPAALLLLSAAIVAAGLVGAAAHYALVGFFGAGRGEVAPLSNRIREVLEEEKALVLRSIKELEFDHAMRKVGEQDFAELSGRLRGRAVDIMARLEQAEREPAPRRKAAPAERRPAAGFCPSCGAATGVNARFCQNCGAKL